jgi:hypothetical protein
MVEVTIQNANYRHNAIACSNCGAVLAFEEVMSVMYMLGKIAERLGVQFAR